MSFKPVKHYGGSVSSGSPGFVASYWVKKPITTCCTNNRFQRGKVINLLGRNIYHYEQVTSTNSIAKLMARCGAVEGTIIMSESQTLGKGRRSRHWECPPGKGLLMSMILRPPVETNNIPKLTLLAGVAVAEGLKRAGIYKVGIKWPNDIIIDGKKVCGILAESLLTKTWGHTVIMGVGININQDILDLPEDCRETSTSLKLQTGTQWSRLQVLKEFITSWEFHYRNMLKSESGYIKEKWIKYNHTLGKRVTVNSGQVSIVGNAVDLSKNGGLLVQLANGEIKEFLADDVSLGRGFYHSPN